MTDFPIEKRKLPLGPELGIEGTHGGAHLQEPLWAINWFNYRFKPSYSLYNLLASPAVIGVGARVHFKGERLRILEGPESHERGTLLIVTYPSARRFLQMATLPYFLVISVFRELGLKDFVFGFTRREDGGAEPWRLPVPARRKPYLVHHFSGNADELRRRLPALEDAARSVGARLHFAGTRQARLVRDGGKEAVPSLFMDAVLVFELPSEKKAGALMDTQAYGNLREITHDDGISVFKRTM